MRGPGERVTRVDPPFLRQRLFYLPLLPARVPLFSFSGVISELGVSVSVCLFDLLFLFFVFFYFSLPLTGAIAYLPYPIGKVLSFHQSIRLSLPSLPPLLGLTRRAVTRVILSFTHPSRSIGCRRYSGFTFPLPPFFCSFFGFLVRVLHSDWGIGICFN